MVQSRSTLLSFSHLISGLYMLELRSQFYFLIFFSFLCGMEQEGVGSDCNKGWDIHISQLYLYWHVEKVTVYAFRAICLPATPGAVGQRGDLEEHIWGGICYHSLTTIESSSLKYSYDCIEATTMAHTSMAALGPHYCQGPLASQCWKGGGGVTPQKTQNFMGFFISKFSLGFLFFF